MTEPIRDGKEAMSAATPLSRRAIQRVAFAGGAAFVLVALIAGYAVVAEWRESTTARHWVDHTYEVIDQIRRVFDDVQDAETGERGYYIMGEEAYLQPYTEALGHFDQDVARLRNMIADNPAQVERANQLEPLMARRIEALRRAVESRRTSGKFVAPDSASRQSPSMKRRCGRERN